MPSPDPTLAADLAAAPCGSRALDDCDADPRDDDVEDGDDEFDCGRGPDGQCSMAGSEWCDWECPLRDLPALRARGAA